ncbi:MAG TPA: FAD-binding oxidoreductase [Solirubrobacter sp.]|nr:FAD-binding oxidoreductase [Solirubrobacter sp.]
MRREQVFWGWGEPGAGPALPEHAVPLLRSELGISGDVVSTPVATLAVPPSALPAAVRERLSAVAQVREDAQARVLRARGKSYLDLLAQRAGAFADVPDAVVAPERVEAVAAVLAVCAEEGVAVVPFGGGTSVVGGLEPVRGRFGALISLDLGALEGVVSVDARSAVAVFEAGIRLPEADAALRAHGLALGHVPQSYEWATVGGCAATRSAGQSSTGHGRFDAQVVALDFVAPTGTLATRDVPGTAAGPSLRQLVLGSEGAFGVITRVAVRVRPARSAAYDAWVLPSFADGCDVLRRLAQDGLAPDIARLSDEEETRLNVALAGTGAVGRRLLEGRSLLICGWEGAVGRTAAARVLVRAGARPLGGGPGRGWERSRFAGPHLRDDLLDRGVLVETLETAASWSRLDTVYGAVRDALPGVHVGCHVSHVYATGASLYFTVLGRQADDPVAQWTGLKERATRAVLDAGGTLTHHHAIGRDHAPWLGEEVGALGLELLRAVKERCDPAGIMNPGKLLVDSAGARLS